MPFRIHNDTLTNDWVTPLVLFNFYKKMSVKGENMKLVEIKTYKVYLKLRLFKILLLLGITLFVPE